MSVFRTGSPRPGAIAASALLVAGLLVAMPARAQLGTVGPNGMTDTGLTKKLRSEAQKPATSAAPEVMPGTKGPSQAADPTRPVSQMSPTEALFDAVNRGDMPAARAAINRGASLTAPNELGLSAVDLSVDLGRNDITFMLLSERGDDSGSPRATRQSGRESDESAPAATRARVVRARAPVVDDDSSPPRAAAATPRVYSGDGGAPIPAAGFLGFSGR